MLYFSKLRITLVSLVTFFFIFIAASNFQDSENSFISKRELMYILPYIKNYKKNICNFYDKDTYHGRDLFSLIILSAFPQARRTI